MGVSSFSGGDPAPANLQGRVVTMRIYSPALGRRERLVVYLPPGYAAGSAHYPLLLLLHGLPGRPDDFVGHGVVGRIDALIAAGEIRPLVVAMPAGGDRATDDTEWADSATRSGERWETYVARDVVDLMQSRYRVRARRASRGIAGISMGGFGAMNLALHHRGEFAAVGSWSGYFHTNTPSVHGTSPAEQARYSPARYVPKLTPSLASEHPAISFYSGSRDRFHGENTAFDRLLTRLGVPHRFTSVPGAGHNWALWSSRVDAEITFLADSLSV